jgi:hypothetical protein
MRWGSSFSSRLALADMQALATELIGYQTQTKLGVIDLAGTPQPGNLVEFQDQTYRILERRHRYQFRKGKYHLTKMVLYVEVLQSLDDMTLIAGEWVIGDANCQFNARSQLVRCAVNPSGPCLGCSHYLPLDRG